jgi:uncharacterized repeat protein (TIGR03803 family)
MPCKLQIIAGLAVAWLLFGCAAPAQDTSFNVLHVFGGTGDGIGPSSGVIFAKQGSLYGEAGGGGSTSCEGGCGLVYELSPQQGGGWTETILYEFTGGADGLGPNGGLAMDADGNLYGVTEFGGANDRGTAFELSPDGSGWTQTVLYSFCSRSSCADGAEPLSAPVLDALGNLLGTTSGHQGVAYELSPGPSGWTETVLYTFCSQPNCSDGDFPGQLIRDSGGNLYGPADEGGGSRNGAIFELSPQPGGQWQYQVLYSFQGGNDGMGPSGVTLHGGALYGITTNGGGSKQCTDGCGTIFKLSASKSGGSPVETILHRFGPSAGGTIPFDAPAFAPDGSLFGVAGFGGTGCGVCGLVFEMSPGGDGKPPAYQVVYQFDGSDGEIPQYLSTDKHGNVYGTTVGGGAPYDGGVVFEITP